VSIATDLPASGPDDPRQFVRISVDLPFGNKTNSVSDPIAAIAAQLIAICASASGFTDGHVPINTIRRAGISDTIVKEMISEGFWHDEHSDLSQCSRCQVPKPKSVYVHDYLRHQRSSDQVQELRAKRQAAGIASANKRWEKRRAAQAVERKEGAKKAKAEGSLSPLHQDIERLCNYLATWVERNDSKNRRPPIGQAWYDDMRKILERDKFSVDEVREVIEWTQKHAFWNKQIKSPFKLREQLKPTKNDLFGKMRAEKYGDSKDHIVHGRERAGRADAGQRAGKALDLAAQLDAQFPSGSEGKEIEA
jgi:undecaprenyl pyrophosphate synthase